MQMKIWPTKCWTFRKRFDSQKAYCAKYFSVINDTLAIDLLRNILIRILILAMNCAVALGMKDEFSYNQAIQNLSQMMNLKAYDQAKQNA